MKISRPLIYCTLLSTLLAVSGCSKDAEVAPSNTVSTGAVKTNAVANPNGGTADLEGANAPAGRGGATVVHEIPKDGKIPAGGLVLTPPDPNDPRYKPAPGMAGGG